MNDLTIIILCYNAKEFLTPCLTTTQTALEGLDTTVYVVDNASTDGTADYVSRAFPWCKVIRSDHNGGYSHGNNLGLKAAGFPDRPRFRNALLLNPDTELPPDALRKMLTYLEGHPDIGVLGPKLLLADGSLDKACKRGTPTPLTSFFHFSGLGHLFPHSRLFGRYNMTFLHENKIAEVDSTVGACQLIRGKALAEVGLMDEGFFMYGEDLDLNFRIRQAGYLVVYYPNVVVKHLKGTSTRKAPECMIRAFYDAMRVFHHKHFAQDHSALLNWIVYRAIDWICQYKLLRNRIKPEEERMVGSAPMG